MGRNCAGRAILALQLALVYTRPPPEFAELIRDTRYHRARLQRAVSGLRNYVPITLIYLKRFLACMRGLREVAHYSYCFILP